MPVLTGAAIAKTVADVNSRTRSLLNDDNAQIWSDAKLLNHIRDAYNWLYGQVVRLQGQTFKLTITDIVYTPTTAGQIQDLATILPHDLYMPVILMYRLNASEEYLELDRRQSLPSRTQQSPERLLEWVSQGNTILVNSANQPGLLQLTYVPLLGDLNLNTDPLLINNSLEAIAHYAAYEAFRRRGQMKNALEVFGRVDATTGVGSGAVFYAHLLLDHIIMNEQEIPRRGAAFTQSQIDTVSNRQYNG